MPTVARRSLLSALLLVVLLAATVACGGGGDSTPAEGEAGADTGGEAAEPVAKPRVAFVTTVPLEQQWASVIHKALSAAEDAGQIEYAVSESTPAEDVPRVQREYGADGYDLVVAETYASEDESRRAAADYPDVNYLLGSSLPPDEAYPNVAVFGTHVEEAAYLCGMVAGGLTESNKLGAIGGFPIPEVNWGINAWVEGAKEVNPDVEVVVTFVNNWFDPPKTKEAALAQLESGVDIIYAERTFAIETIDERGALSTGNIIDIGQQFPDTVFCGALWNMEPALQEAIENVKSGSFEATDYSEFITLASGGQEQAPYHNLEDRVPDDLKQQVEARKQEIIDGSFTVEADASEPQSG